MSILAKIMRGIGLCLQVGLLGLPVWFHTLYETRIGFMRQILYMNETYPILIIWILWLVTLGVAGYQVIRLLGNRYLMDGLSVLDLVWLMILILVSIAIVVLVYQATLIEGIYDLLLVTLAILIQVVLVRRDRIKIVHQ